MVFQQAIQSQNLSNKISIEFSNTSRLKVLEIIEKTSNHKFYYDTEWLVNDNTLISGKYNETAFTSILFDIFKDTDLNYFLIDNKVILTRNNIIYDTFPENFDDAKLGKSQQENIATANKPNFLKQYDSIAINPRKFYDKNISNRSAIISVGKESKNSSKIFYTLSGYIKNKKTNEPVSNVAIKVLNNNKKTTTDKKGYYVVELSPGLNIVETETYSYRILSKKIMSYGDGTLDFNLDEDVNQLDEVIVKKNSNKNVRSVISGATTIDSKNIRNIPLILGERDLLKVAITLPGTKTTGEGSAGFNVRGGKDDQNLILLDDAVLYNPSHFFGFFSALNPYTTDKVDIYKGSIPTEFGGRLSSVFDIQTKKGNVDKFNGEGGIGPVTSNLSISTPIVKGKSSLIAGARATYSGWILRSLDEESLKNSQASFYDGILKYNHLINKNNDVETTLYNSHDTFSISSDSLYKYSNRLASLKWNHSFNERNKAKLLLTNSEYKFNIDYDSGQPNSFDFGYRINESQLMLKLNYIFNDKHKINYGVSLKSYIISPGSLEPKKPASLLQSVNIESEKGIESALYISDNFKLSQKLLIDVGLRYSLYTSLGKSLQRIYEPNVPKSDATVIETRSFKNNEVIKSYNGLEPRLAARYVISDDLSVKASYDKTFQYIHLLSSNTTQAPTDTWKLSDLNVKPQSSHQYSLGLYKNLSKDVLELSLEGYYKKSSKILDYKVGAELILNENVETELLQGEGKAYGIEVLLKKQIGSLNGWIGYTYSRTYIKLNSKFNDEKVNNGAFFPTNFDKPHDFSAILNYKFTKRYSFSSNFIYQTGRPITYPIGTYTYGNAEYTLYSDRNKFRIPDYYRLDIGLNIEGNHKLKKLAHSFWNISVYNVLGRNNPYSIYFVTNNGEVKAYKTSIFSIPIPSITYNFKF